jgi:hypothetical protein
MSFFSKLFSAKDENNSPSTSELGEYLFGLCLRQTNSFINDLTEQSQKNKNLIRVNADDIDVLELLIAFMWLYFDFLQIEKFRKSLDVMHGCFFDFVKKNGGDGKSAYDLLSARYDEYRHNFRNQETPNYTLVAYRISANIQHLDSPVDFMLQTMIIICFQANILTVGKDIIRKTPKD